MIKVIDDFVNPAYYEAIETIILALDFGWNFNPSITRMPGIKDSNMFGFTHGIFDTGNPASPFYEFLLPMFLQVKGETSAKVLLRARGDMTVNSGERITYEPHIDMMKHKEHVNVIFYIGNSDGDTIIYKEKYFSPTPYVEPELPKTLTVEQHVTPKANRLVIFNGEHWHTGQSPKNHSRRVILNLNFAQDDYRMNIKPL